MATKNSKKKTKTARKPKRAQPVAVAAVATATPAAAAAPAPAATAAATAPPAAPAALWVRLLRRLRGYFLTGLVVAMPLVITLYLANWFIGFVDNQILPLIRRVLPAESSGWLDIQGLGLMVAVVLLIFLGWLAGYVFGQSLINLGERIVNRVPLLRSIYNALKQIFQTVISDSTKNFRGVCLVEYPRPGVYALAFITTGLKGEIENKIGTKKKDESIAIFLPTTPNPTSGFLLFVPRSKVQLLTMSVESGIKMVISGGLIEPPSRPPPSRPPSLAHARGVKSAR